MGCKVCGAGIDWSLWPEWVWIKTGTFLISTPLGFMLWEYLCVHCHSWAKRHGVIWDSTTAKMGFGFTGWKVSPKGNITGSVAARVSRVPFRAGRTS